jgi:hypothetical protein
MWRGPTILARQSLFSLSLRERVRVRGFKSMHQAEKLLTPRPLPWGEGAKAMSPENLKFI